MVTATDGTGTENSVRDMDEDEPGREIGLVCY